MKRILMYSLMIGWALAAYSQHVIELEETELTFVPSAKVIFEDYGNGNLRISEAYSNQFENNAIRFLKENFDIHEFLRLNKTENFDQVMVLFSSSRGSLKAQYDKNGELVKTFQKFRDLPLPKAVTEQVQHNYRNWSVVHNKYLATSRKDEIVKEKYVIHIQKGSMKDRLVITPKYDSRLGDIGLAQNKP